jgi:ABC-2 type transport system permease protein
MTFAYKIPGVAFDKYWKAIFMGVLPYGLIATIPVEVLTLSMPLGTFLYGTLISILFMSIALIVWTCGLKRYDSASS